MSTPKSTLVQFASLREFWTACPEKAPAGWGMNEVEEWSGNQTYTEARANLWKGFPDAVKRSDKLLAKIEAEGIELRQESWDTDLIGYFPCVPAFVSGDPDCMFTPIDECSQTAPMRVYASVCLSAGFESDDLEKRGVAILALVRKLSLIRPVELYLYADQAGKQPVIRMETCPLDLITASYALSNAGFLRKLCFGWGYTGNGFDGGWAYGWGGGTADAARKALGADPTDLVIPGSHYSNADLLKDPVKWVNDHVIQYAGLAQEAV